jgi:hypothetical protein
MDAIDRCSTSVSPPKDFRRSTLLGAESVRSFDSSVACLTWHLRDDRTVPFELASTRDATVEEHSSRSFAPTFSCCRGEVAAANNPGACRTRVELGNSAIHVINVAVHG